jgi:hypothetical protein
MMAATHNRSGAVNPKLASGFFDSEPAVRIRQTASLSVGTHQENAVFYRGVVSGCAVAPNSAANAPFTVTLNNRPAQIRGGSALDAVGVDHQWLTTNTGVSVGMGTAQGVPVSDYPGVSTYVVDHTGQVPTSTTTYTNVDQTAFGTYTQVGTPLGAWVPVVNDCNTWASNVLYQSTPHDVTVVTVTSSPIGAEYGGYYGGNSVTTTTYHNVVQYADGSIHQPGGP